MAQQNPTLPGAGSSKFTYRVDGCVGANRWSVTMGVALWRVLTEWGAIGLAADAFAAGFPAVACAALMAGTEIILRDALPMYPVEASDVRYLLAENDERIVRVEVHDTSFDPLTPSAPMPTIAAWSAALDV